MHACPSSYSHSSTVGYVLMVLMTLAIVAFIGYLVATQVEPYAEAFHLRYEAEDWM